jgi:hypothetical protein
MALSRALATLARVSVTAGRLVVADLFLADADIVVTARALHTLVVVATVIVGLTGRIGSLTLGDRDAPVVHTRCAVATAHLVVIPATDGANRMTALAVQAQGVDEAALAGITAGFLQVRVVGNEATRSFTVA